LKNLRIRSNLIIFTLCILLIPLSAGAARLGKLTIQSAPAEPLLAEIALSATPEELQTLVARIAPSEDYAEQGIGYSPALSSVHIEIARRSDNAPVIRLDSTKAQSTPFLELLIQADWANGRTMRAYTTETNTPVFSQQQRASASNAPMSDVEPATSQAGTVAEKASPEPTNIDASKENASALSESASALVSSDVPISDASVNLKAPVVPPQAGKTELQSNDGTLITRRGDTLFSISSKFKVNGVSTAQMLQGIYQANKSAFIGQNMNLLKVGQKIHLPSPEVLREVVQKDIQIQSADWRMYSIKLAEQAQESDFSNENTAHHSRKVKLRVQTQPNAVSDNSGARNVVKLSSTFSPNGFTGKGDKTKQATIIADDAIARENEIRQIEENRSFLENQVEKSRALLKIKNNKLANKISAVSPSAADGEASVPLRSRMFDFVGALLTLIGVAWLYLRNRRHKLNEMNFGI